ncbi:hypothetical protein [Streptomyces sp. MZ04]|nr:hypothetical protein [Streptomyces sp. MZ04]
MKSEQVAAGGDESVSWEMTGAAQGYLLSTQITKVKTTLAK